MTWRLISDGGAELERVKRRGGPVLGYRPYWGMAQAVISWVLPWGEWECHAAGGPFKGVTHYQLLPAPPEDTAALEGK